MWGRTQKTTDDTAPADAPPGSLKEAVRQTRIEMAEKSGVVVDLRDAEQARLELLNDALDPLFDETPPEIDLFDRGISRGDTPRLWIDAIAHVMMGPDKRVYRLVQDTSYGRRVLAEAGETGPIVEAVTQYIARRLVERERTLADQPLADPRRERRSRRGTVKAFLLGLIFGVLALVAAIWLLASYP
jgi:hypothetical protein